jgi:Zn-dependent protease
VANIDFTVVLVELVVLLISLTVHEAAHAWTADRLGDPTARLLGRVSLNPAVHIDPIGTLVFPLIAIVTNVPVLGWAKPVPVNTLNLRGHWKRKYMLIAAAGPASNLVLAAAVAIVVRALSIGDADVVSGRVAYFLLQAISLNVLLAVFNMVPIPPLDGGNVLAGLLHGSASEMFDRLRPYGFVILYALMLSGALATIIMPPAAFIFSLLV